MRSSPADVAVVGAGVIGVSCAYHLAKLGVRVTVVERGAQPGLGSTGKATGGFRAQFDNELDVRLSLLAREKLRAFPDELGVDSGYRPYGYLWLGRSQGQLERLRAANAVQHAAGLLEARIVSPAEAARLCPEADLQGVEGGAFCPSDGFVRPLEILRGYVEGARRLGVQFRFGEAVVAVGHGELRTTAGSVRCGRVVDAAGPWAAELAALAGVQLPVTPLRRQVACTVATSLLPETTPMTIWLDDGFHFRVRDGRVLLLLPEPEAPRFDTPVEDAWLSRVVALAHERLPLLRDLPIERSWAGLYEMSPDAQVILGPATPELFLCNGSSGHGVMHAPALGQLTAEWIVHGAPRSLDCSGLSLDRFNDPAKASRALL